MSLTLTLYGEHLCFFMEELILGVGQYKMIKSNTAVVSVGQYWNLLFYTDRLYIYNYT